MDTPDHLACLHVRRVRYSTRVNDDDIRLPPRGSLLKMKVLHGLLDGGAICLSGSTAKIDNVERLFHLILRLPSLVPNCAGARATWRTRRFPLRRRGFSVPADS